MTQLEKKHVKIVTTILKKNISAMMEERLKNKFKLLWSTIPTISAKSTTASQF
jgi:hypothetical protein